MFKRYMHKQWDQCRENRVEIAYLIWLCLLLFNVTGAENHNKLRELRSLFATTY